MQPLYHLYLGSIRKDCATHVIKGLFYRGGGGGHVLRTLVDMRGLPSINYVC